MVAYGGVFLSVALPCRQRTEAEASSQCTCMLLELSCAKAGSGKERNELHGVGLHRCYARSGRERLTTVFLCDLHIGEGGEEKKGFGSF